MPPIPPLLVLPVPNSPASGPCPQQRGFQHGVQQAIGEALHKIDKGVCPFQRAFEHVHQRIPGERLKLNGLQLWASRASASLVVSFA